MTIETYTTPCGTFSIDTIADAQIARRLRNGVCHQENVIDLLATFFKKGDTVIDVGAHIGTISIPLALRGAQVIAFEPSDEAYPLLLKNIETNKVSVDARNKGLGAKPACARLAEGETGNAGSRSLREGEGDIEIVRLDDEVESAMAIKMDVEGMELSVLQGAQKLIEKSHPVILFEMNLSQMRLYHATPRAVQTFLESRGYNLFYQMNVNGIEQLGKVRSLSLLTACITPGTIVFGRQSYAFDILAVPKGHSVASAPLGAFTTHARVALKKIADIFSRSFKNILHS